MARWAPGHRAELNSIFRVDRNVLSQNQQRTVIACSAYDSTASKCRCFTYRERCVNLALGCEPVIELMAGPEAAALRKIVRGLGDHAEPARYHEGFSSVSDCELPCSYMSLRACKVCVVWICWSRADGLGGDANLRFPLKFDPDRFVGIVFLRPLGRLPKRNQEWQGSEVRLPWSIVLHKSSCIRPSKETHDSGG